MHMRVCIHVYVVTCRCVCVYMCMCVCVYVCMCACVYVCMVCMCVCVWECVFIARLPTPFACSRIAAGILFHLVHLRSLSVAITNIGKMPRGQSCWRLRLAGNGYFVCYGDGVQSYTHTHMHIHTYTYTHLLTHIHTHIRTYTHTVTSDTSSVHGASSDRWLT